jgi:hypothetical protein
MDPRLQAGLELQLEKQAQQEYDSSLSGVLGQYFKQATETLSEENVTSEQSRLGGLGGMGGLALTSTDALVKVLKAHGQQVEAARRATAIADKNQSSTPIVAAGESTKQK